VLGTDVEIVLFGLGVGILIGLTGIGGGSLMTPLLIVVIGISPVVAVGTDLAYGAVTKTLGGLRHLRKGTVDLTVSKWLLCGSAPGALLGSLAVDRLHRAYGAGFNTALLAFVAVALLLVASVTLTRAIFLRRLVAREREGFDFSKRTRLGAGALGFVLGVLLGLTSVGSGALIGLALILVFRLTPRRVVGTDVFHAALILWVAAIVHVASGSVDYALMGKILLGSLPGVWLGSQLIDRVPAGALRVALGAVMLGSALAVLNKAGVPLPVGVILGAPLAVGVLAFAQHRVRPRAPDDLPPGPRPGRDPAVALIGER
jgi:uncharacterized protein